MLKPIRWRSFPRDLAVIQVGFALFGGSIALMIRANLGTSPWAVLEVALGQVAGISTGSAAVLTGMVVLLGALALREPIGWGTVANILSIGPWIDAWLWLIPNLTGNLLLQVACLLLSIWIMGLATAVYIGVNAGAGPRDSLMLAVHRTAGLSLRVARASVEISVVALGWLMGGPAGVGTLVFALLIGPAVQTAFRLFRMPTKPVTPATS